MDGRRFDLLARTLGRRGLLAAFLGLTGAMSLRFDPAGAITTCTEQTTGQRCRKNGQCCSDRCQKKKGKRKGKCRCSELRKPCAEDGDCCGHLDSSGTSPVCSILTGSTLTRCCAPSGGSCGADEDCCGTLSCGNLDQCVQF